MGSLRTIIGSNMCQTVGDMGQFPGDFLTKLGYFTPCSWQISPQLPRVNKKVPRRGFSTYYYVGRNPKANHLGCIPNLVNNGISLISTGFLAGFLNHQQVLSFNNMWAIGKMKRPESGLSLEASLLVFRLRFAKLWVILSIIVVQSP